MIEIGENSAAYSARNKYAYKHAGVTFECHQAATRGSICVGRATPRGHFDDVLEAFPVSALREDGKVVEFSK